MVVVSYSEFDPLQLLPLEPSMSTQNQSYEINLYSLGNSNDSS